MSFASFSRGRVARLGLLGVAVGLLAGAYGCTYEHGEPAPACDITRETITYSGVISPIFDRHCRECHSTASAASLGGGNDFGSYQAVARYPSASLLGSIEHSPGYDAMPKGGNKVPDCDIARIKAWMAAGKPNN